MRQAQPIPAAVILALALLLAFASLPAAASPLPGPEQAPSFQDSPGAFLTGPNSGDPLDIALAYIEANKGELGLSDSDLADLVVSDRHTSQHNGVTHIYLSQRYQGIDVYNALLNINIAADGSVISLGNRAVPGLAKAVNAKVPTLSAVQAVEAAARSLNLKLAQPLTVQEALGGANQAVTLSDGGISLEPIPVKLMYQPMADGSLRLAWDLSIYELDAQDWWSLRVDAETGKILDQVNQVIHDTFGAPETAKAQSAPSAAPQAKIGVAPLVGGGSYNVYALPMESPNHGSQARTLVTDPANATASPYGWHDTNGSAGAEYTYTRGNNAYAYLDAINDGSPDVPGQPDGGSSLNFDFPINLSQQPSTYQPAAVTNLFYWNNIIHDVFYQYGFDEASGNFQENNYGRGGAGSDSVNAEAQDGGGTNNANFATPTDGGNPRMQMYLWNYTNPMRDGDLDNGIIIHEYGHGISIRLTGGPSTSSCLNNNEQGGEGWSDYFTVLMTIEPGDAGTDRRGVGTYALGQSTTGTGIRAYPYSTSMAIDPRTYDAIKGAAVPHGVGSVWTAMVWEMTWALIDQYGFDADLYNGTGGNNIALQLVVDGLKLQPCSPGFVDARNAILQADQVNNGGANQCTIWGAFAKRGLGYSASQGSSGSTTDGTQAFDLPPACLQTLKLTKSASPSPVEAGSQLTYSLLVENDTVGDLTNVTITDNLPQDTTYVPGSATCGGSLSGGVVTFPLNTMGAGTSQTCTFRVTVSGALGTTQFFVDDMESGSGSWSATHGSGSIDWNLGTANAHSPTRAWFAQDVSTVTDQYLAMTSGVTLSGSPILRFWHNYATEASYDGGVVEISANGGAWTDLGSLMTQGGYNGTISTCCSNPLAGRQAFAGSSGGYVETLVDLSSYVGDSVRIRFRLGTDSSVASTGWYVDDVEIVDEASVSNTACVSATEGDNACDSVVTQVLPGSGGNNPPAFTSDPVVEADATENVAYSGTLADDASDPDGDSLGYSKVPGGPNWLNVAPDGTLSGTPGSTDVGANSWTVQVSDGNGGVDTATLEIAVIAQPAFVDQFATSDVPGAGTVSGTYLDTQADGGGVQSITERQSGGKPADRYDYLEHTWTFTLQPGTAHTFNVNAWQGSIGDADAFGFAYSTDGANFIGMGILVGATGDTTTYSASLPGNLSGTVYVRVTDTDRLASSGLNLETVFVDLMYIRTDSPGNPPEPVLMHVGDLDGGSASAPRNRWTATVTITVHAADHSPVDGATVLGAWSNGTSGSDSCVTNTAGECSVVKANLKTNVPSVTWAVVSITRPGDTYSGPNHDPDLDSDGTSIVVVLP